MKKIIGISIAILSCNLSFSQGNPQIQNKKEVDIMPVQGEFALGINAAPFLRYIGDIFGRTSSNTSIQGNKFVPNYFSSNTIFGKYMITNDNAIRVNFRIANFKDVNNYDVYNDAFNSPDSLVIDTRTSNSSVFNIGAGYEFRRGTTRLRGIYGGEVIYNRVKSKTSYDYGNAFAASNQTPTSIYNANGSFLGGNGQNVAERRTSVNNGAGNGFGLRAFAGVEYYIAPKICIGTEFGWAANYMYFKQSSTVTQYFDPTATAADGSIGSVMSRETIDSGSRELDLDTDNFNGSLYLMFYF